MTAARLDGETVVPGRAAGPILRLGAPISFWGGVDPATGRIQNPRHPDHDKSIGGTVLALPGTVGSSSSSAIMLELIHAGCAPAGVLVATVDASLVLGILVAREMGWPTIPVVRLSPEELASLPNGAQAAIEDGVLTY